jgi:16S rRNA (guanine527-N7)-methyltransferase
MLQTLYTDWNAKINVISRQDINNLYLHHVLHSMSIEKMIHFTPGTVVMDVGTGGGFPGIPLAILFPDVTFHLIDGTAKKIKVAQDVADKIGLKNVFLRQNRAEYEKMCIDFAITRATMTIPDLVKLLKNNISVQQNNPLPNGLICLKGGDTQHEIKTFKKQSIVIKLSDYFNEDFFINKKIIYVQL